MTTWHDTKEKAFLYTQTHLTAQTQTNKQISTHIHTNKKRALLRFIGRKERISQASIGREDEERKKEKSKTISLINDCYYH